MNPKDKPVKFPKGTRVKVTRGTNVGQVGTIEEERHGGFNNRVRFDVGGHAWFPDSDLEALPVPEVGDLVRVKATGRWQAHEGHVSGIDKKAGLVFVDLDYDWEKPAFHDYQLEVIEKVKPLPVRIEGKPIKPEDIKRGDKISVVSVEENEIKRTTILEATVDKIIKKGFYGQHFEFQTRSGKKIYNNELGDESVISLVADIDKDLDFEALSEIKPHEIIGFPDEDGGLEVNIAVKKEYSDQWTVILGEKSAKSMTTVGLVTVLKKKNVTFSVIRSAKPESEFEFPVGTNVKVSPNYSTSLSQGDYRVVIAGPDQSTIKSRGISAATHSVPNRWLTKGIS